VLRRGIRARNATGSGSSASTGDGKELATIHENSPC
jgi:hypothetical protein